MSQDSAGERLVYAYSRMLERIKVRLEHTQHDSLAQHIDAARKKAVELGELTREEAEKIAAYLKRDLHDAAQHMSVTGQELADWLRFDLQLIEQRALDMLALMVDRTRLELDNLTLRAAAAENQPSWHTGEIAGIGTLRCSECGQLVHFHVVGRIPPCPRCHATLFERNRIASLDD